MRFTGRGGEQTKRSAMGLPWQAVGKRAIRSIPGACAAAQWRSPTAVLRLALAAGWGRAMARELGA